MTDAELAAAASAFTFAVQQCKSVAYDKRVIDGRLIDAERAVAVARAKCVELFGRAKAEGQTS